MLVASTGMVANKCAAAGTQTHPTWGSLVALPLFQVATRHLAILHPVGAMTTVTRILTVAVFFLRPPYFCMSMDFRKALWLIKWDLYASDDTILEFASASASRANSGMKTSAGRAVCAAKPAIGQEAADRK